MYSFLSNTTLNRHLLCLCFVVLALQGTAIQTDKAPTLQQGCVFIWMAVHSKVVYSVCTHQFTNLQSSTLAEITESCVRTLTVAYNATHVVTLR